MFEQKRRPAEHRRWTERFLNTIPLVDASGNPVQQDPPLNKEGFWKKPDKTISELLRKEIKKNVKRTRKDYK